MEKVSIEKDKKPSSDNYHRACDDASTGSTNVQEGHLTESITPICGGSSFQKYRTSTPECFSLSQLEVSGSSFRKEYGNKFAYNENISASCSFSFRDSGYNSQSQEFLNSKLIGTRIGEEKVDMMTELLKLNCTLICEKIMHYLTDQDIVRFAAVSQNWRQLCLQDPISNKKRQSYLIARTNYLQGMENRYRRKSSNTQLLRTPLSGERTPLSDIQSLTNRITSCESKPEKEVMEIKSPLEHYRHCPACHSPSLQHGDYCYCKRCEADFCIYCGNDMKYHNFNTCTANLTPDQFIGAIITHPSRRLIKKRLRRL